MDLDQTHYQNYPDKIIIKSELAMICGDTGFLRQWQAEGWEIIQNTCVQILIWKQVAMPTLSLSQEPGKSNVYKHSLK